MCTKTFVSCVEGLDHMPPVTRRQLEKSLCFFGVALKRLSAADPPVYDADDCLTQRDYPSMVDRRECPAHHHLLLSVGNLYELGDYAFIPNGTNERYVLSGTQSGVIELNSTSPFGMLRGLQTLLQMLQPVPVTTERERGGYLLLTGLPFYIDDQPLFPYRGVLIDSARRHLSVEFIETVLGWMASIKLNVLHWHLSDDGAFPVALDSHPELALRDTMNDQGAIYSRADIERIVNVARAYGIRVVPEFDMPGHCGGWTGIAGLISHCPQFACSRAWSVTLAPDDRTMSVVKEVLAELFELFPDPFFHLGGDEVETACWAEDPRLPSWGANKDRLFCLFETKLHEIVGKTGKKIIRWQEHWELTQDSACRHTHADVYQMWRNFMPSSSISRGAVGEGKRLVTSVDWYLDANCFDWDDCWQTDPLRYLGLDSQLHGLDGGEVCIWDFSEEMWKTTRMPYRAMAAVAGRLWGPKWTSSPPPTEEVGNLIKAACLHASAIGVVPDGVCVRKPPVFDVFRSIEYQNNRREQERRMCGRIRK